MSIYRSCVIYHISNIVCIMIKWCIYIYAYHDYASCIIDTFIFIICAGAATATRGAAGCSVRAQGDEEGAEAGAVTGTATWKGNKGDPYRTRKAGWRENMLGILAKNSGFNHIPTNLWISLELMDHWSDIYIHIYIYIYEAFHWFHQHGKFKPSTVSVCI